MSSRQILATINRLENQLKKTPWATPEYLKLDREIGQLMTEYYKALSKGN